MWIRGTKNGIHAQLADYSLHAMYFWYHVAARPEHISFARLRLRMRQAACSSLHILSSEDSEAHEVSI